MRCYPHSIAAALFVYSRLPEWEEMGFVLDFLAPGDMFIDVGANVGGYSLLAAATPGVDIWAFEPSTSAYQRLLENVSINCLGPRVRLHQVAVGAAAGRVLVSTGQDAGNHVLLPGEAVAGEVVPMVSLDDVIAPEHRPSVRLIKVDVEGLEEAVLRGASSILAAAAPVLIVEANDLPSLRRLLAPLEYRPCRYDPERRRLEEGDWTLRRGFNVLLIRDRALVESRLSERGARTGRPA